MVRNCSCTSCFIITFPYAWKISSVKTAYAILSRLDAGGIIICGICSHSHPCSQRIIHGCIQALPYRISVYRKQADNSETMTSTRKTQNGNHQVWYMEAIRIDIYVFNNHHRIAVLNKTSMTPVRFCSSTYVDIADNNRKNQANPLPAFHMLSLVAWRTWDFRRLIWHLTGMTGSSQHDHRYAITWRNPATRNWQILWFPDSLSDKRPIPGFLTLTYAIMTEPRSHWRFHHYRITKNTVSSNPLPAFHMNASIADHQSIGQCNEASETGNAKTMDYSECLDIMLASDYHASRTKSACERSISR